VPGRVLDTLHWDVLRLWNDIEDGLRKVASQHGAGLSGIGVDTWGVDFGLLDANDQLLSNPVHYRDARNNGMMEAVFQTVPRSQVFESTGLQFLPFNTLFQMMALKTYNQPQLGIAETLLFMPDLLHFGSAALRPASTRLLPLHRCWTRAPAVGTTGCCKNSSCRHIFCKTSWRREHNWELCAPMSQRVATWCEHADRRAGSHDTASAIAAVPAQGENWAYLSSGTWSLMGIELPEPLIDTACCSAASPTKAEWRTRFAS
jgi:rhamnulokinase